MNLKKQFAFTVLATLILTSCAGDDENPAASIATSYKTFYGYSYAIENSIRELSGDDNPELTGFKYSLVADGGTTLNQLIESLDQTGTTYDMVNREAFSWTLAATTTEPDFYKSTVAGEKSIYMRLNEYAAEFDFKDGTRARIGVGQETAVPYALSRPSGGGDFTDLANQTFTGLSIIPDGTADPEGFSNPGGSSITFGAGIGNAVTGTIGGVSIAASMLINTTAGDPVIAGSHSTYIATNGTSQALAIVASPDRKALVFAFCSNANCINDVSGNDVENYFDVSSGQSDMIFGLLVDP